MLCILLGLSLSVSEVFQGLLGVCNVFAQVCF